MGIRGAKRIQSLIEEHQDTIRLCKKLTEIKCDAEPLNGSVELQRNQCDDAELEKLFCEIGFGNLRRERWGRLLDSG